MNLKIALAGNPNCGKTTLFNALTGSNQIVGNWPGVTVEKKEGKLKKHEGIIVTDLPGIYSLSPYTLEEVVARNYLINERPDVILNIVDGTNLERNLYLTTQLMEIGIPVVMAINMIDVVNKNGDKIKTSELSKKLGIAAVEISALKGTGITEAVNEALMASKSKKSIGALTFSPPVEKILSHIEASVLASLPTESRRWYAIKIFERDNKILKELKLTGNVLSNIEAEIKSTENEFDDDSESIITNERYNYISTIIKNSYKKRNQDSLSLSDKIDHIVTNRWLGLPIFAAIMFVVYWLAMGPLGTMLTDWANDGVFGEGWHLFGIGSSAYANASASSDPSSFGIWIPGIPVLIGNFLESINTAEWLNGLILDGIVGGVGAVLGFVPQMLILFFLLAFLEACGYMSRIAFVLDRVFRKFGLSGKSFIPMLIGTGCGVPGIMASRTIENDRDRRMTITTTTFIPCGAKIPFIAMISGALFGGSALISTSAYFIGMAAVISSGLILKRTRLFSGDPAPFVMELPSYHLPTLLNLLRSMWERGWSFIKKASTIILLSTLAVWFISYFGFVDGSFRMLTENELSFSLLASIGNAISWIFAPLGWGTWQASVATITGLVAKENIVGTMGILYGSSGNLYASLADAYSGISGYSFMVFNLLCAPCFAAIGAIRREMNSSKWTWFAICYQCGFAYITALLINIFGNLFKNNASLGTIAVSILLIIIVILIIKKIFSDKKRGKGCCDGDCGKCHKGCLDKPI